MRKLTTSIITGLAALMLLTGSALTALAETEADATISFTINDGAAISITAIASPFSAIAYDDENTRDWSTNGHLTLMIADPRYAKGDWAVTISTGGVESTGTPSTIESSLDLTSVNAVPSISTNNLTNIEGGDDPALLLTADDTLTTSNVNLYFDAVMRVPTKTQPGTYTATVTVNLTSTRD